MGVITKIRDKFVEDTGRHPILNTDDMNDLMERMREVVKESESERDTLYKESKTWFAWALSDRKNMDMQKSGMIPTGESGIIPKKEWQSVYHIPVISRLLFALVAILSGDQFEIKAVPKVDSQQLGRVLNRIYKDDVPEYSVEEISQMSNVYFQRLRDSLGWHDILHDTWMELGVFDHVFTRMIIDKVSDFPNACVNIQKLNVWQVFHTAGRSLKDSTEVAAVFYMEPSELTAAFPEFEDDIKELKPTSGVDKESGHGRKTRVSSEPGSTRIWASKSMPKYGETIIKKSKTSILVREFYQFDTSWKRYSESRDLDEMDREHALLDEYIRNPMAMPFPEELLFDDRQYHSRHMAGHQAMIEEWLTIPLGEVNSIALERAMAFLKQQHMPQHQRAIDYLKENDGDEGYYPKYANGWRQTIILGDGGDELCVYDGVSRYVEYGIRGHPFHEFNMMGWPMHNYGPSFVALLLDINKIVDGALNFTLDNLKQSGNNKLEMAKRVKDGSEISNDPAEPNVYDIESFNEGLVRWQPGLPSNPTGPALIQMMNNEAAQTSGIFNVARGGSDTGVRSGTQVEQMTGAVMAQLGSVHRRMITPLKKLCMDVLKASLVVPPPDDVFGPAGDDTSPRINYKLLQSLDYAIEIKVVPAPANVRQEQLQFLQAFIQNFGQMLAGLPSGLEFIMALMEPIFAQDAPPELKQVIEQIKAEMMQLKQNQQGLPQEQPGGAPPQAGM